MLSDDEAIALARLGLQVEEHYGAPQDVEWAIAGGETYLVQSRPITTLGAASRAGQRADPGDRPAAAARPGRVAGRRRPARVRVLRSPDGGRQLAARARCSSRR